MLQSLTAGPLLGSSSGSVVLAKMLHFSETEMPVSPHPWGWCADIRSEHTGKHPSWRAGLKYYDAAIFLPPSALVFSSVTLGMIINGQRAEVSFRLEITHGRSLAWGLVPRWVMHIAVHSDSDDCCNFFFVTQEKITVKYSPEIHRYRNVLSPKQHIQILLFFSVWRKQLRPFVEYACTLPTLLQQVTLKNDRQKLGLQPSASCHTRRSCCSFLSWICMSWR